MFGLGEFRRMKDSSIIINSGTLAKIACSSSIDSYLSTCIALSESSGKISLTLTLLAQFNASSGQTAFNATTFPNIHGSGKTVINYLWRSIPGVQKFGEYIGGGNDNGTLVELGLRPALVWVKCHDAAGQEWVVWDD